MELYKRIYIPDFSHILKDYFTGTWTVIWFPQWSCPGVYECTNHTNPFLHEASFGLRVLSLPVSVCVCVCECVGLNPELVCPITYHLFKLGSPNLDWRFKTLWLISLFMEWRLTLTFKVKFNFKCQNLPHFELVHVISHHRLNIEPHNLDKRCKTPWLRLLLF